MRCHGDTLNLESIPRLHPLRLRLPKDPADPEQLASVISWSRERWDTASEERRFHGNRQARREQEH